MTPLTLGDLIRPAATRRAGKGSDLPLLSMTMHNGLVDQSQKFKKRVASADVSQYKIVTLGQLVVGFPIDEGVLSFQNLYPEALVSPAYGIWEIKDPERVSEEYLQRFLKSPLAMSYYAGKLRGSTARRRSLPPEAFLALPVPLPDISEQRRIAAMLDQAEARLTARLNQLLKIKSLKFQLSEALYHDQNTSRVKLETLIYAKQLGLSRSVAEQSPDREYPYLKMDCITSDGDLINVTHANVDASDAEFKKYSVRDGDLLFNTRNSRELVGKSTVYRGEPKLFNNNLLRITFRQPTDSYLVHAYLWTKQGRKALDSCKSGTTNVFAIYARDLMKIPIPQVNRESSKKFIEVIKEIEGLSQKIHSAAALNKELYKSLETRAFRGELYPMP